jgi:uncharacterized protein
MALHKLLPTLVSLLFFVRYAPAQEPIPASTSVRLATLARLEGLKSDDFSRLRARAQVGQREAQYLVALVYEEGHLVARDDQATAGWMLKSAEQEYVPAEAEMGRICLADARENVPIPQRAKAEKWLRLAAAQGDADAQFWLGRAYQSGWFGAFDDRQAFGWFRRAAAQGLPDAQLSLGDMYAAGEGVLQSDLAAAGWYRRAADHSPANLDGVFAAEVQLTYMYRGGRLKDKVQAYKWFAIVGSSVDPPIDDEIRDAAQHMTRAQIVKAQRLAEDWIKRHPWQPQTTTANSLSPAP